MRHRLKGTGCTIVSDTAVVRPKFTERNQLQVDLILKLTSLLAKLCFNLHNNQRQEHFTEYLDLTFFKLNLTCDMVTQLCLSIMTVD